MAARVTDTSKSSGVRVRAVPIDAVRVTGGFWADRMHANRVRGIPRLYERLEAHGVVDNFRRRAGLDVERRGLWFTDSDLYKWMEAAAWSIASSAGDDGIAPTLDDVVEVVLRAQADDGYLNTNFDGDARFRDLSWSHELYCAGHFFQAAVAHRRATGSSDLLDAATRFADLLCREFGPGARDQRDLHPGIETALVELYRETGTSRYLDLAATLLDRAPHREWQQLWGHAVCATYFQTGLVDVAIERDDESRVVESLAFWDDFVGHKQYVTGGAGGRWVSESVGRRFELPNEGAYAETCAAIGAMHWHWRLLQRTGWSHFADAFETALHNAFLVGVSLDGDEWFYANPLASRGEPEEHPFIGDRLPVQLAGPFPLQRRPWRDVTCCPPNATRALASLPGYLFGTDDDGGLWVHLYVASTVDAGGWRVRVGTNLPWDGHVTVVVEAAPPGERALHLRVPEWSASVSLRHALNAGGRPSRDGYLEVRRRWDAGEHVEVELDVAPHLVECDPRVAENRGSVAIRRGPLLYCVESVDNPGVDVLALRLEREAAFRVEHDAGRLGGVDVVHTHGRVESPWLLGLYQRRGNYVPEPSRPVEIAAIPYFAWANRGPSAMTVWVPA